MLGGPLAKPRSSAFCSSPYSPKCVEGEFCELRLLGILGSSGAFLVLFRTLCPGAHTLPSHKGMLPSLRGQLKGAYKFETVRNDQVTAKITHLREGAPHNTHCSSHNCKCVDGSRVLPRP